MGVSYRSGTEADLLPAAELFVESMLDLCVRHGMPATPPDPLKIVPWYRHIAETGIFEVAEENGALVAFASGIVRDGVLADVGRGVSGAPEVPGSHFFLSMFWSRPGRQQQGVGRPVLARVWEAARARGATIFGVWSSVDYAALGTYLRTGMRPVGPIVTFGGAPRTLPIDVELRPLDVVTAGEVDRAVRGTERPIDHAFFLREKAIAHAVRSERGPAGYFYAHEGRLGPVAWLDDRDARPLLRAAVETARPSGETVSLAVPGPSSAAIDVALEAGLKILSTSHLLWTERFCALDRYVPSGPALF